MKKVISILCVVLMIGFSSIAFAKKKPKVDVCHNGSVYTGSTDDGAVYIPDAWEDGSFVINISGNAVTKHVVNHGDLLDFQEGVDVTTEVSLEVDEDGNQIVIGFEEQTSCEELEPEPEPTE